MGLSKPDESEVLAEPGESEVLWLPEPVRVIVERPPTSVSMASAVSDLGEDSEERRPRSRSCLARLSGKSCEQEQSPCLTSNDEAGDISSRGLVLPTQRGSRRSQRPDLIYHQPRLDYLSPCVSK